MQKLQNNILDQSSTTFLNFPASAVLVCKYLVLSSIP